MFGLRESDIKNIHEKLSAFPEVKEALIFGSRAKGNYTNGSDVDIAVKGENISFERILSLAVCLNEETPMPYHFDILDYHAIQNTDLTARIDRAGISFYKQ